MKPNQNLLIAQCVKFLNERGYFVWRQENNGRFDESFIVEKLTALLFALAHVNYDKTKISSLILPILRSAYRPVPSSIKGVPDIIGFDLQTGLWMAVEVKVGDDKIRPEQESFIHILRKSGGDCWIIRDIESFKLAFIKFEQRRNNKPSTNHQPEFQTVSPTNFQSSSQTITSINNSKANQPINQ